jgi:hypothetical protein
MAENHLSTRPPIACKPHRYQVDEGLDVRFLRHANSAHVLQTLWRGLLRNTLLLLDLTTHGFRVTNNLQRESKGER